MKKTVAQPQIRASVEEANTSTLAYGTVASSGRRKYAPPSRRRTQVPDLTCSDLPERGVLRGAPRDPCHSNHCALVKHPFKALTCERAAALGPSSAVVLAVRR